MTLYELCKNNNTDKFCLGYADYYEKIFNRDWTKIFELGVLHGGSLRAWREWFPKARIFGLDNNSNPIINGSVLNHLSDEEKRDFTIFIGDENNPGFLREASNALGQVDLIIDDASHEAADQVRAFNHFKTNVRVGGLYIVEDLPLDVMELSQWWGDFSTAPGLLFKELVTFPVTKIGVFEQT